MVDQITLSRAIAFAALLPGLLLVGLLGAAIVARLRGRGVGRVWHHLLAVAVGGHFGFALLFTRGELVLRPVALFAALVVGLWLLWRDRRADAGWFALAVALPWTIVWGYFLVLIVAGVDFEPYTTAATFLLGAVPAAVAAVVAVAGDPPPPEPRADAPIAQPGSRRIGQLSAALRAAMSVGPLTTMELAGIGSLWLLTATIAVLPAALPPIAQAAVLIGAGTILATEVGLRAVPSRVRQALEAFHWVGEWELARARRIGVRDQISTPRKAERWLTRVPERPEDRWLRWEFLVLVGRFDEAAEVAARMPEDTAYERFERAYALERVAWAAGGSGDVAAAREAAEGIGPLTNEDRLRAEVALAVGEAQRRAADGRDALEPLVAVRRLLGQRPDVGIGALFVSRMRLTMFGSAILLAGLFFLAGPVSQVLGDVLR